MKEIIVQEFIIRDNNDDGVLDEIEIIFEKNGKGTSKITTDAGVLSFFQKLYDKIKAEL